MKNQTIQLALYETLQYLCNFYNSVVLKTPLISKIQYPVFF